MKKPFVACIKFYDHSMVNGNETQDLEPIICEVYGVIYKETKLAYYIASWVTNGILDHNTEQFVILKSAVLKVRRLK